MKTCKEVIVEVSSMILIMINIGLFETQVADYQVRGECK